MTKDEQQVIDAHLKSPSLGKYGETELQTAVMILLYKISIITGWKIPDEKTYQDILSEQLVLKIKESYSDLNANEIEYAFRQNCTVKDWGKAFNLSLIDQVLIPYCNQRTDILSFVSRVKVNENQLEYYPESDWRELCQLNYEQFLTGTYNLDLWPWQLYNEFVKQKMMAEDLFTDFLEQAYESITNVPAETQKEKDLLHEIKSTGVAHIACENKAKRLGVRYLYQTAKKKGIKDLF